MHPLAKAPVAAAAAWVLSVAFAWVVRKAPVAGRFFARAAAEPVAERKLTHELDERHVHAADNTLGEQLRILQGAETLETLVAADGPT